MSTPYTYFLQWTNTNMNYYGCQYGKRCDPSNLWTKYKTSSEYVQRYCLDNGDPDIIEVRKTFTTKEETLKHEHKVLRRIKAKDRQDFLNETNGRDWKQTSEGFRWIRNHPNKNKATEVRYIKKEDNLPEGWFYGFRGSSEKQKQAAREHNKKYRHSSETKRKISQSQKGEKNHRYGKRMSAQERKMYSESAPKGKDNPSFVGYWVLPHGVFSSKNSASKQSKYHIGNDTIIKWCKNKNNHLVTKNHIARSEYLKGMFDVNLIVGKTFGEIGFGFIPVS
jgi:hypothetical protein